jgi:putative CRISPR-associated protein (TIGR02619 family)
MPAPNFILSPCGTSLLTNESDSDERRLVSDNANRKTPDDVPADSRVRLQALIDRVRKKMKEADLKDAAKYSAELNGIINYYAGQFGQNRDEHYLLCTDTWLGETTAQIVADWLRQNNFIVQVNRQKDLQTADLKPFQLALSELVRWCDEILPGYRRSGYYVVFNLTGGFKSVQGFLQTLAGFYADETVYIFENSKELLRIPRLPMNMAAEETVRDNVDVFRRLSLLFPVEDTLGIPESLLLNDGNDNVLSPWGELIWQQTKKDLYAEKLHRSPTAKIEYSAEFIKSLEGLEGKFMARVNQKIDDLARYVESGRKLELSSLDFKQLKADPRPPSTHEFDAWADEAAKRIFGHFREGVFVLDKLDKKLQ